ncbi:hypothetical protein QCA50_003607 [Cerrena zonata]|uniref:F-box domain-containing protein n=1 Tax=Cerrena zonata TaxID=2478898 RepID=A0AAW0GMP6_9APHY
MSVTILSPLERIPILPPELIDETIDHLWDDHKALEACSLTSRSWVPSSRLHLFRTVRVRSAEDCIKLSALLQSSPIIAHCIRKLTIDAEYKGVDEDGTPSEDDSWVNEATGLLSKLRRVHTLALSRVKWTSLSYSTRNAFTSVFSTVKTLLLFEVQFHASGDVLRFLSRFPVLSELYFHGVSWDRETPPPEPEDYHLGEHMDLTYLFLDPKSSPTLVTEWLLRHPSEKKLRTIQLCWREIENTETLGALLQSSGSDLECLRVEFPSGLSEEALLRNQLTLAHNTGLRTLHFGGLDVTAATARTLFSDRLFTWIAVMLGQVRSSLLREVVFELELPEVHDLQSLDWTRINRELSRPEFDGLLLRFYVNCTRRDRSPSLEAEILREVESRLPDFIEQGSLRVSCI